MAVTATDANTLALTYSAEGLPPGLTINTSTGVISGTIATGAADSSTVYSPVITVTDGTAVATQGFTWNLASPITITVLFTQNSTEGSSVSLSFLQVVLQETVGGDAEYPGGSDDTAYWKAFSTNKAMRNWLVLRHTLIMG